MYKPELLDCITITDDLCWARCNYENKQNIYVIDTTIFNPQYGNITSISYTIKIPYYYTFRLEKAMQKLYSKQIKEDMKTNL